MGTIMIIEDQRSTLPHTPGQTIPRVVEQRLTDHTLPNSISHWYDLARYEPIIEDGTLGEFTTSLALYVYDYLAGVKKQEHRRMLTREETMEYEPLINSEILKGGALYYEYLTDDSRLTIEVI